MGNVMRCRLPTRRRPAAAILVSFVLSVLASTSPTVGGGDSPHRLLAEKAAALATVKFVLKVKMGAGGDREIEGETTCPLIDAEGLVLCFNTELGGYVSLMSRMMGHGGGFNVSAALQDSSSECMS